MIFFRTAGGHPLVKVGLFDFAAAGALVLTNRFPEVERYFRYGTEIVGFDSTAELLASVRHLLDHPAEAEAIRQAGRRRVLAEHTWTRVWPRLLRRLGEEDVGASGVAVPGWWPRLRRLLGAPAA